MRKIKTLEMFPDEANNEDEKWMREKLNGMSQFLNRLENLSLQLSAQNVDIQELLKNEDLLSNLTSLTLSSSLKFDNNLVVLLQKCKNLKFLSFGIKWGVNSPEFLEFLACMRNLPHLTGLDFDLPRDLKKYWSSFKPQASLRSLKLRLEVADLVKAGLVGPKAKDPLGHWEDIKELDELEFSVSCKKINDLVLLRMFITMVLKKVGKLSSLKCSVYSDFKPEDFSLTCEPFLVEEIPRLYESLQKFEYTIQNSSGNGSHLGFDMNKMKMFRNLKEVKFNGNGLYSENIEEMVELLERNQKEGDFATLKLQFWSISSSKWLKDTIEKISQMKRPEKNLKIEIDLRFRIDDMIGNELKILDELCDARNSVGFIKGLMVYFGFFARDSIDPISIEDLKGVVNKYGGVRNLIVEMDYLTKILQFRKVDGEKEQFYVDVVQMW